MLKLTQSQLDVIEAGYKLKRRMRILSKLRSAGWVGPKEPDGVALTKIDRAIADGKSIEIVEDEDVEQLCALAFLPDRYKENHRVADLLARVLTNVSSPAEERLDFVFTHIVGKAPGTKLSRFDH